MRRVLKLGSVAIVVIAVAVSFIGGQAKAIVGGTNATQQYGAVSLWYPDRHRCAASLISEYWALTSAHCQAILIPGQTQVRTSSLNNNSNFEEVGLAQVYAHPGWVPGTATNDLALIRFERPVTRTQPLVLPWASPGVNSTGIVAGWGWTCEDVSNPMCGHVVNVLQQLSVKVIEDAKCGWSQSPQTELCGIASSGAKAMACNGDSGSPLVRKTIVGNRHMLLGVTYGDGDYDVDHPNPCATNVNGEQGTGIWEDVSKYIPWISDTITQAAGSSQVPAVVKQ